MPPPVGYADLQRSKEAFRYILAPTEGSPPDHSIFHIRYWGHVDDSCLGRSFISTREGYIGLAPKTTKVGDIVCVLLGSSTPMVLRATEDGHYKVVGQCYVHGLMYGEALLGPLPERFQFLWQTDDEFGRNVAYLDRETGQTLVEDPRLGQLPAGWREKSHKAERAYSLFVKDSDSIDTNRESDVEGTQYDPRLTPEALALRNVILDDFELV